MMGRYGNPHSRTHSYGWETEEAVESAREVSHYVLYGYVIMYLHIKNSINY